MRLETFWANSAPESGHVVIAPRLALLAALASTALVTLSSPATLYATARSPIARAARTISATDEADLHYVRQRSSESHLFEEGAARGTLPGSVHAECHLGADFSANVTIYTQGGTIHGHGTATPRASGIYESFAGTLVITGGTGRYAHAHGHAGLYGLFNRRTYALTVQTTGSLSY
jgi:hypothetical protein